MECVDSGLRVQPLQGQLEFRPIENQLTKEQQLEAEQQHVSVIVVMAGDCLPALQMELSRYQPLSSQPEPRYI